MTREFTPKVVTANDLLDGDVIYMTNAGAWTRVLGGAALFLDPHAAQKALGEALQQPGVVVGPYLANATSGPRGPVAVHFREEFRAHGPSNYAPGRQQQSAA